jgi:ribonuclease Y
MTTTTSPIVGLLAQGAPNAAAPITYVLLAVAAAVFGFALFQASRMRREGLRLIDRSIADAESKAKTIELEAERRIAERRAEVDAKLNKSLAEIQESQTRAARREETLDRKLEQLDQRERRMDEREKALQAGERQQAEVRESLARERVAIQDRLSQISGLTPEQAREVLMAEVRMHAERDAALLTQKVLHDAEARSREQAREIVLMAIQRYAGETSSDSTVRSVKVPSEDLKGRVIGREGRNIRHFEKVTGVDVLIDDTPGVIAVSCFDRVRQAIAVEALQRLVADGRVHPARIEDVVAQVRRDMEQRITKAGEEAALEADVRNLHPRVIEALGRLSFRTSYAQNVLRHSIEVAFLSQMIADQLGLDGRLARRCGLLHDLGKAMDHEMEGGHPAIGRDFLVRHGERNEAVLNAVAGHHGDIPSTTPYTPIVMAADALSGARPGARRESMEQYVKRLQQLEAIAREHAGVTEAFAVQAGREVRVIVDAGSVDDARTRAIADSIAARVEREMTFPGEIKVSVLREVRAEASAR